MESLSRSEKISHALALLGIAVTIVIAVLSYTFPVSPNQEKNGAEKKSVALSYSTNTVLSPHELKASSDDGSDIKIDVKYKSISLKNGYVFNSQLTNMGTNSIKPGDIFEPIKISMPKKWNIVDVKSFGSLNPEWKKNSRGEFFIDPLLINPNDSIFVRIIADGPGVEERVDFLGRKVNVFRPSNDAVSWTARIENLQNIEPVLEENNATEKIIRDVVYDPFGFAVNLYGLSIGFFIAIFCINFGFYVNIIIHMKRESFIFSNIFRAYVGTALFSIWSSEAAASIFHGYVIGDPPSLILNILPMLFNTLIMLYFYLQSRK